MHSKLKTLNLIAAFNCFLQNSSCPKKYSTLGVGPYESLPAVVQNWKKRCSISFLFSCFHSTHQFIALRYIQDQALQLEVKTRANVLREVGERKTMRRNSIRKKNYLIN